MSYLTPAMIGLVQGLIVAAAVIGFAVAFRLLEFPDLTVEASVPLGAGTYAVLVHHGWVPVAAVLVASAIGAAAGACTAALHMRFGVNKFLAGIIVVAISYSLTLRIMAGPNISLLQSRSLLGFSSSWFTDVPGLGVALVLLLVVSLLAAVMMWFLSGRIGTAMRAAGSNPVFAETVGVRPGLAIVAGVAGCNAIAAFAGVLQADYQGFADVSGGQGVLILALAALAIGEAMVPTRSISFYRHVVIAAVVGSIAYQVIVAFAVRAGLAPTDLRLVTGLLVLGVIAIRASRRETSLAELRP